MHKVGVKDGGVSEVNRKYDFRFSENFSSSFSKCFDVVSPASPLLWLIAWKNLTGNEILLKSLFWVIAAAVAALAVVIIAAAVSVANCH